MEELEKVVRQLEKGELTLDQSITSFESGVKLSRECEKKLNEAKGKVEQLMKDEAGKTKTEPFEPKD
jgi:exodeoxyribonuclease VII small subunit